MFKKPQEEVADSVPVLAVAKDLELGLVETETDIPDTKNNNNNMKKKNKKKKQILPQWAPLK